MIDDPAACLILTKGEEVLCTECLSPLARAERDIYGFPLKGMKVLQRGRRERVGGESVLRCLHCGNGAATASRVGGAAGGSLLEARAPRLLVRSGRWTGWRIVGGE